MCIVVISHSSSGKLLTFSALSSLFYSLFFHLIFSVHLKIALICTTICQICVYYFIQPPKHNSNLNLNFTNCSLVLCSWSLFGGLLLHHWLMNGNVFTYIHHTHFVCKQLSFLWGDPFLSFFLNLLSLMMMMIMVITNKYTQVYTKCTYALQNCILHSV